MTNRKQTNLISATYSVTVDGDVMFLRAIFVIWASDLNSS